MRIALSETTVPLRRRKETGSILVVSFASSEQKFMQRMRRSKHIWRQLDKLNFQYRWFSPGENFVAELVIWHINDKVEEASRAGLPFRRIIFDGVDSLENNLPQIATNRQFWPCLLQYLGSLNDTPTCFFVSRSKTVGTLGSGVDYLMEVESPLEQQGDAHLISTVTPYGERSSFLLPS